MVSTTSSGRKVKQGYVVDVDQRDWLAEQGKARSTSASAFLRQVIRAAMDAARPDETRVA
jgi:hypothetical protein